MLEDVKPKAYLIQHAMAATVKAILITDDSSLTEDQWKVVEDKLDIITKTGKELTTYVKDVLTNK